MKPNKLIIPVIVALAAVAFFSIFIVKEVNQAIVLQFGDPKRIISKPGLNFKIPFIQNVVFLDKRILNLDTPPEEVIASDQKRLIVDAFARFQIIDPLKFYISVGNERVARSRLSTIINSRIRSVLGTQELQTLLSKDRSKQMASIQEGVNNEAENFGIKIVDVRIKRADLPQANSDAIYKRMQTEREREAKEFRAKGAEMAITITSTADKEVTVILAEAERIRLSKKGEQAGEFIGRQEILPQTSPKQGRPISDARLMGLPALRSMYNKARTSLPINMRQFFDMYGTMDTGDFSESQLNAVRDAYARSQTKERLADKKARGLDPNLVEYTDWATQGADERRGAQYADVGGEYQSPLDFVKSMFDPSYQAKSLLGQFNVETNPETGRPTDPIKTVPEAGNPDESSRTILDELEVNAPSSVDVTAPAAVPPHAPNPKPAADSSTAGPIE